MRPRVFPAEDLRLALGCNQHAPCFNEAAGIPRGRRWLVSNQITDWIRFNEAAGIPRGRLERCRWDTVCTLSFNEAAGIPRGRRSGSIPRSAA